MIAPDFGDFEYLGASVQLIFKTECSVHFAILGRSVAYETGSSENRSGQEITITDVTVSANEVVGEIVVHHPCEDSVQARLIMTLPNRWCDEAKLEDLREVLFSLLQIPKSDSWELTATDGEEFFMLTSE